MINPKLKFEIRNLVNLSLEGRISDDQYRYLNELLGSNENALDYYLELIEIHQALISSNWEIEYNMIFSSRKVMEMLEELGDYERNAPLVEIPKVQSSPELIQKVVYPPREKRTISKFNIFMLVNAAAVILFFVFLRYAPPKGGVEVATLEDSINASWGNNSGSMEKGTRLITRPEELLFLKEGLAELLFDNNAKVVIEGPAEFELLAEDQINLQYGRIYATVPKEAIGFIINTPESRVIDLGTEFGVQVDRYGDMYLHVTKGKTSLIAGRNASKVNVEVSEGQAKKVSAAASTILDVPCEKELFARDISSDCSYVWRGQTEIDLAYIVAGGDGFTQGNVSSGIDPGTGHINRLVIQEFERRSDPAYYPVSNRRFIDGVFVPNGSAGINRVSSEGHEFDGFPVTDSYYWSDITANPTVLDTSIDGLIERLVNIQSPGQEENKNLQSMLLIHPNAGITFDLNKIRESIPQQEISRFTATCGIPDSVSQTNKSEFWVLVDGRGVYHYQHSKDMLGSEVVVVSLKPEDRFLTLATTDGGDTIVYDWCVFASPQLKLQKKSGVK